MTPLPRFIRSPRRAWFLSALALCVAAAFVVLLPSRAHSQPVASATRAAGAAHTPTASTARQHAYPLKMIWGPVTLPNGSSAFPTYHHLGVQVFEIDLDWSATAPSKPADPQDPSDPAYHWPAQLDYALAQSARYGIKVCLLVKNSPGWANGNRTGEWAPNDPADYANFLIAAAHRYPTVRDWMIWGEPNRDQPGGDFEPMPPNSPVGPRRYALLLDAGYHALKHVSRSNIVIGGNTWSFGVVEPADFVKWMRLPNGHPPPLDYFGHNPFGRRFPNLRENPYYHGGRDINDIDTLESQLRRTYHHRVMLWLSEFTISSDHNTYAFDFHVSRRGQARWLTAAFKLADSVDYVAGLGWFNLLDSPASTPYKLRLTNGLMTWSMKRKPAFYAYEHAR